MAIIWRHSALSHRHAEIGGELEDWNGMGTAWFHVSATVSPLTSTENICVVGAEGFDI